MENKKSKPSRAVRFTAYTLFAVLLLVVFMLASELYLRSHPNYGRTGFRYDSNLYYRLTPKLVAQKPYAQWHGDRDPFTLRFNNLGFRGQDFKKNKPDDVKRILVIGDSYTAGLDYPDDEIFTGQWERLLNEQGNGSYEVMNASCPAWGTDQMYLWWNLEGKKLKPDKLVVMMNSNDLREMWCHGLIRLKDDSNEFIIKKPILSFSERNGWRLASKSSLFQFLQKNVFETDYGNFGRLYNFYPVNYGTLDSTDWDMPLFIKNQLPEVDSSYELMGHLLADMKADCDEIGADFHFVKFPIRNEYDTIYQDSVFDARLVEKRASSMAQRYGLKFHNLNTRLDQHDNPKDLYMDWEHHFDIDGHNWVAKALFEEIKF